MISVIYDEKARRMSYWPYATTLLNCAGRQVWPPSTDTADLLGAGAAACNRSDRHDQCVDTAESDDAEPRWLHSGFAAGTGVVSLTVPLIFPRIRVSRKVLGPRFRGDERMMQPTDLLPVKSQSGTTAVASISSFASFSTSAPTCTSVMAGKCLPMTLR